MRTFHRDFAFPKLPGEYSTSSIKLADNCVASVSCNAQNAFLLTLYNLGHFGLLFVLVSKLTVPEMVCHGMNGLFKRLPVLLKGCVFFVILLRDFYEDPLASRR